ncbi:LysM peptidoglycan-binding domain-containing protein [Streptomyces sp. NRRL B-24484]|uniref:LysM peptidoglycan-binding domain-containing protein n=1 Tax=Streptomyces sp. NRRL B-24484 TaxID=1463833 RepID=UPI0004C09A6F|nr:LysM peptidoglycan-binding domain-containing protein [Streptomyces sp. NRRL B-24484]
MSKTRPATATRTAGDLVRAGLAGLALLALLAAVPWGLITFIGNPLPDSMPTWSTLNESVGTTVIINTIAVVLWAVWAQFAFCVAVELRAALSGIGRLPLRVPAAGVNQALARQLVATMLLVSAGALTVGTATAAPASAAAAPRAATTAAAVPQQAASAVTAAPGAAAATEQHLPIYVVKAPSEGHRDSLWRIAEQHLGDGTRWSEIQTLNEGRPQPDGGSLGSNSRIRPGWTLLLPADAVGDDLTRPNTATSLQSADGAGKHLVTVVEGDTLSGIAERELGDGDKYPLLLDATKDLVQPDGSHLSDPDELFPGQKIVIPGPAAAAPASPAPSTAAPVTPPSAATPPAQTAAPQTPSPEATAVPQQSAQPSASATAQAPAPATSTGQPSAPAESAPATAPPAGATASGDHAGQQFIVSAREVTGVGALLGAGLLATLTTRRLLQYRRRRPGQTVAVAEETSRLEALLGRTAQPGSATLLDHALRTLAESVPADEELPEVRAARVTAGGVELLPEDNTLEPVAPFTAGADGWWTLDPEAPLLDDLHAQRVPAPYPGLVTIGRDEAGNHILLNLPHVQVLLLNGTPANVRSVARSIALDAATCPWADHVDVVTAGFDRDLGGLLAKGRIRVTPSAHAGIVDVAELRAEALQAEEAGEEGPLPWLMVCTEDPGEHTWELAEVLSTTRGRHVAVVLPGDAEGIAEYFPDAEVLDADALAAQACDLADTEVVLTRVTDEEHQQLTAALRVTVQEAAPAAGAWEFVPDPDQVPPRFGPASIPSPVTFGDHVPPDVLTRHSAAALEDAAGDEDEDEVEGGDGLAPAEDVEDQTPPEAGEDSGGQVPVALTKPVTSRDRVPVAPSPDQPQLLVLGPIAIANSQGSETAHPPRLAALAAYLYFRPGRDYGSIANAMDPVSPWEPRTLQTRIYELRSQLGHAPDGSLYVPRKSGDTYRLGQIHCDWTWLEYLAERGLPRGIDGLDDLEQALSLVRGRPFGNDGDHDWATPLAQQMVCRVLDLAHTVACLRLQDAAFDLDAARRAIAIGLEVQEDEQLYRDWLRVEAASGSRQGLFRVIDAAKSAMAQLDSDLEPTTKRLISELLGQRA